MKTATLAVPEIGLIALTRVILGVGIGLLIYDKLHADQPRSIGWTCVAVGALSTIPLAAHVLGQD